MRMRKALAVGLSAISLASLPSLSPSAMAATPLRIGVAYDTGGPGDHSYNDAVAQGLTLAKKRFAMQVTANVTIGSDADRELRLRALVAKNCDPVIAVGAGYAVPLKNVALDFPSTQFVIVNDASVSMLNVTSLVFSENQGGYLAGITAALATKSGQIALIGAVGQSTVYEDGFTAGARSVKKDITVDARYSADSTATTVKSLISAGSDVIFITTAGSASDAVNATVNANKNGANAGLILIEPDQYVSLSPTAKKVLLASLVKRVDKAIVDVVSESSAGRTLTDVLDPSAGIYGHRYGIQDGGLELSLWSPVVSKYRKVINLAAIRASKLSL